ncbi:MAG TPA: peptidase M49 [Thermoanaerobaculia bacterium]|nr:peptidase M49 [Thermoanaerobaculia bacterium]
MKKRCRLPVAFAALSIVLLAAPWAAWGAPAAASPGPLVERIGRRAFIQVETPSFEKLPVAQRILAYHLTRAAIELDPIIYDQMSTYGLAAKRLLGAMVDRPERLPAASRPAIVEYAKLFFASSGNHDETTNQKFLPGLSFEEFAQAAEAARSQGARLGSQADLKKLLAELKAPLFDPDFEVSVTVRNPPPGKDLLTASSNNYYSGVALGDLSGFTEKYPLDSRLVKKDGKLVEEVYRAGTPDGKVPPGLYAKELQAVNRELAAAAAVADRVDPGQAEEIRALIRFYQTGELADWTSFNVLWVKNDSPVDFASGFIEVYKDSRGVKGSSQMFVSVTDQILEPLMQKLASNAVYFEKQAPWAEKYKKLDVKPPIGKAIETVVETGDFRVGTIGDNLPNEQSFREVYGTKSLLFTSSIAALTPLRGEKVAAEFSGDPGDAASFTKDGILADNLHTAMHEIIGHGSGKVEVKGDPATFLREFYSTLEEARADLVAYWNISDPKMAEFGVKDVPAVAHELYRQVARSGLLVLARYPKGDIAEEDHDRSRLLVANYLIEAGGLERFERNGHWYIGVKDYDKAHAAVGKLLAEIMRIKAQGDYPAIKALVEKYGVHFDPAVRDDVLARFNKLNLPSYFAGVYPDLSPVLDSGGQIVDVKLSYPRDFLAQQVKFARINGTLGF